VAYSSCRIKVGITAPAVRGTADCTGGRAAWRLKMLPQT
jgi:hypothetical protein